MNPTSAQLQLALDWGRTPWCGFTARSLTRGYLWDVEKSRRIDEAARRDDLDPDPAQLEMWVHPLPLSS